VTLRARWPEPASRAGQRSGGSGLQRTLAAGTAWQRHGASGDSVDEAGTTGRTRPVWHGYANLTDCRVAGILHGGDRQRMQVRVDVARDENGGDEQ
jgi:hypothetical protein